MNIASGQLFTASSKLKYKAIHISPAIIIVIHRTPLSGQKQKFINRTPDLCRKQPL
jgi:hypothetical protein